MIASLSFGGVLWEEVTDMGMEAEGGDVRPAAGALESVREGEGWWRCCEICCRDGILVILVLDGG